MSSALSGPAGFLGREMKLGIEAAFHEINNNGGVNGNIVNLVAMDDKYEPFYTEINMKRFAADDNFIAVLGNVGTPTAKVALPIAQHYKLPFIGAFTGSHLLRYKTQDPYVINYRASYAEEMNNIIKGLFRSGITIDEIAFFTQDDDYGDSGYLGLIKSLNLFNVDINKIQNIPHGRYTRNTTYVEDGFNKIKNSQRNIKAIIIVGAHKPVAKFIKLAKEYYPAAYFINVSFVSAEALQHELCLGNTTLCNEYTRNVVITQVVPRLDSNIPIIKQYHLALTQYLSLNPHNDVDKITEFERQPNAISFEGYIVGKMFALALNKIQNHPTRDNLIKSFLNLGDFDLGLGYKLNISPDQQQASSTIFPVTLKSNNINSFNWKSIIYKKGLSND